MSKLIQLLNRLPREPEELLPPEEHYREMVVEAEHERTHRQYMEMMTRRTVVREPFEYRDFPAMSDHDKEVVYTVFR